MTLQGQLAESVQSTQWPGMPSFTVPRGSATEDVGLLGNKSIQVLVSSFAADSVVASYRKLLSSAQPSFKLAVLKRQKFTAEGRRERIAASLAALNGPQPTELSLADWKAVLEEVEDED